MYAIGLLTKHLHMFRELAWDRLPHCVIPNTPPLLSAAPYSSAAIEDRTSPTVSPRKINNRLSSEGHNPYSASAELRSFDDRPTTGVLATPTIAEPQATPPVTLISCRSSARLLNIASPPKQLFAPCLHHFRGYSGQHQK